MAKYNCNAYSIDCIEFCSSKLPMAWQITPCVSFSLLSGAGYATACEGEIGCLLAMNLFSRHCGQIRLHGESQSLPAGPEKPFYAPYFWVNDAVQDKADFTFAHNVPHAQDGGGSETPDLPF